MATPGFIFGTDIENSFPAVSNGTVRVDEMEKCGHHQHWATDFTQVQSVGIHFLRQDPPLHLAWLSPYLYDWDFADMAG